MGTTTWERGRGADKPSDIPKAGWKDTLSRVKVEIKKDRISMVSAAMAYYGLFALVPALSSLVLIYAFFSDPTQISKHLTVIEEFIPPELKGFLEMTLTSLAKGANPSLGIGAIVGLLISLWSASKASKSLIDALNIIYDQEERRGFFRYSALALGLTLFAILLVIIAIAVIVGLPTITHFLQIPAGFNFAITILSWLILLALFSLFLSVAYRYSPNRNKAKWKWVSWGAVTASVLWAITSGLFSWYASEFADFNKTYGSLGAVIVLMMWLYLSSFVVLLGGEINAEMEHQTAKDTTKDPSKPMGSRRAHMADTLGADAQEIKRAR